MASSDLSNHSGLANLAGLGNKTGLTNHLSCGVVTSSCRVKGLFTYAALALSLQLAVNHDLLGAAEPDDAEDRDGNADDNSDDDSDYCASCN